MRLSSAYGICLSIIVLMAAYPLIAGVYARPEIQASAPFSIDITPKTATVKAGDSITYHIQVNASSDFNDAISFTLDVSVATYNASFNLGIVNPPYPKEFNFSFNSPSETPATVTGIAVVKGTSGSYVQTETVQLTIQSQAPGGDFFGWLVKIFNDFWNWLMKLLGR